MFLESLDVDISILKILVENVFAKTGANTFQVDDVFGILFDGFDLFVEEFSFKIIGKMWITRTKFDIFMAETIS